MNIVATTPLTGTYSYKHDTTSVNAVGSVEVVGGGSTTVDRWIRARFRIDSFPATPILLRIMITSTNTTGFHVHLDSATGKLQLNNGSTGAIIGSPSIATVGVGQSFLVELNTNLSSGNAELRLNETTVATTTGQTLGSVNSNLFFGQLVAPGLGVVTYVDDIAVNDNTVGGVQTSWPGEGKVVLLIPVSDNSVGAGWTLGTGTAISSNGFTAVANEPPLGKADLAANSDPWQIRNAAANANVDYKGNTGTYLAAGLGLRDSVTLCQAVIATGAPSATSAKTGNLGATNPTITLATIGTFYQGASLAGVYPTGWKITRSAIQYAPAVTLGSGAVLDVQQITASTRIAMVCFLGMLVEYVPVLPEELMGRPDGLRGLMQMQQLLAM